MSEEAYVQIIFPIKKEVLERLKQSLPNRDQKKSGTQAIQDAVDHSIASFGAVTLDESMRRELASRSGQPLPKDSKAVMACFEAATHITPHTVHVDIDPGVAAEILGHAQGRGMTFQEMAKEVIEQSVVDRYLFSLSLRAMVFHPATWKALAAELGGAPKSGDELVRAIHEMISNAYREGQQSVRDVALANSEVKG